MILTLIRTVRRIFHEIIEMEKEMLSLRRGLKYSNLVGNYIASCPRNKREALMKTAFKLAFKGYKPDEILSHIKLIRDWNLAAKLNLKRAILKG